MNRRYFVSSLTKFALLITAFGSALFTAGCNVFNEILTWIPVGEASLDSILAVLANNGVVISPAIQKIVSLIEAGFAALTAAIKEYQSASPAPVGALAKVQEAFKDIVDNFNSFLQSLSISSGLLAIITGLAKVVLSTIAAFVNRLPSTPAKAHTMTAASSVKIGNTSVAIEPKFRSKAAFRNDFNGELKAAPADVKVPASAYLK